MIKYFTGLLFASFILGSSCSNKRVDDINNINITEENVDSTNSQSVDSLALLRTEVDILIGKMDFSGALDRVDRLLLIDSLNGKFQFKKAYCLAQLDKDQLAVESYLKAIELNYNRFECYRSLGVIYFFRLNNNEKAEYYFNECLKINPNDNEIIELLNSVKQMKEQI